MFKSSVEDFLHHWFINDSKVFYYKNNLYIDDLVVIKKLDENDYNLIENLSTTIIENFNKEKLTLLLIQDQLKYYIEAKYTQDYKYIRSGYCTCGSWVTKDNNCHAFYCKMYKPFKD